MRFSLNEKAQIIAAVTELLEMEPARSNALVDWCEWLQG